MSGWRERRTRRRVAENRVADLVTRFSGSWTFVLVHVIWFSLWVVLNLVVRRPWDPFPFGLLTLIVSLEAIFLSTFVLISQNRSALRDDLRAEQDFRADVYSEVLSELIADKVGVDRRDVEQRVQQRVRSADEENRLELDSPRRKAR